MLILDHVWKLKLLMVSIKCLKLILSRVTEFADEDEEPQDATVHVCDIS